jgi:LTXXQ motif family protein
MKLRVMHFLPRLSVAATLALAPLPSIAQNAPMMGGGMKGDHTMGGGQDHMMGGGMMEGGQDLMMGGGMKGCEMMMGGGMGDMSRMMSMMMDHMSHMISMMHEKVAHEGERIASLKTELKITEAQTPAWNKFADALLAAGKSMEQSMEGMQKQMTQPAAGASLPAKLERHAKMAAAREANLNAIKAALDPLYASFGDEQKKIADGLNIGPMGLM